jgi:hypothetical protein
MFVPNPTGHVRPVFTQNPHRPVPQFVPSRPGGPMPQQIRPGQAPIPPPGPTQAQGMRPPITLDQIKAMAQMRMMEQVNKGIVPGAAAVPN